ncbi:MAG: undecaprenyl-diphosphate phosphatase [Gemmatales bacterium]|nr:undecaprenyl-diphosphate phosphatase [Gemmatales bacterium]MDW8175257.1 undecaprenyl-diphosphate phosphatase [Gemmatales bacterium]
MEWWHALVLGVLQGIAEFLPISSSGHLVLVQQFFPLIGEQASAALFFDGMLHLGTTFAVAWYLTRERSWHDPVPNFSSESPSPPCDEKSSHGHARSDTPGSGAVWHTESEPTARTLSWWNWLWLLGWGSGPAVLTVLLLDRSIRESFVSAPLVAVNFLCLGTLLWLTDQLPAGKITLSELRWYHGVLIGMGQALSAVMRGLSRSGMTLAVALLLNVERLSAVRYSFALALIANLGLAGLGCLNLLRAEDSASWLNADFMTKTAVATLVSAAVGYLTLKPLLNLVRRARLRWFSYYLWSVGLLAWWHYVARSG